MPDFNGTAGNDSLSGGSGDDIITGEGGNDTLRGNGGQDQISGGDDQDYLIGGDGDDTLDGGSGVDRAGWYQTDPLLGGATVSLLIAGPQYTGSQGWDTLIGIENLSGTPFADVLTGDSGDNWLWGAAATIGPNNISTTNADTLDGGDGNDLLTVGIGNHTLIGGTGIDTVRFTENGAPETGVTISLGLQGAAQDTGNGSWTLTGIENLSGGLGNDVLTGDFNANTLAGDLGNDTINGGGGADLLLGDGYIRNDLNGIVSISYEGLAGQGGNDFLNGGGGNDILYGGAGMDFLLGSSGNDTLYAGDGDDYLSGDAGNDLIDGGAGIDRASFYHAIPGVPGVTVSLLLQGQAQNLGAFGTDTLIGIEHLSGSVFADALTGDGGDNWLWGSGVFSNNVQLSTTNDDTLDGGAGNDLLQVGQGNHTLIGGADTDTVSFAENADLTTGLTISLAAQGGAQATGYGNWTLTGIENLSGAVNNDILTGDGNANVLAGSLGNDQLNGGGGNDSLYGDGEIRADLHGLGGSGPIVTIADVFAAGLYVGAVPGNDLLEGGIGNDTLDGGGGIDTATYAHASGGVTVNLNAGTSGGADGNDTLTNIENVTGSEFNDNLTGNTGANVIEGLGGNDTLQGHAGDDTIFGGSGNDTINGDLNELNTSVSGNDTIHGGDGNDSIRGGLGNDAMFGGANNDLFRGGGGVDSFDGGIDDGEDFNGIGDRVSFFEQLATQGVIADLRTGIITNDGFGNSETMTGIESLGGDTAFVDTFYGNDVRNALIAGRGDYLYGFGGDDILQTGAAAAMADGGSGTDRLVATNFGSWLAPDTNGDGLAETVAAATIGWTVNLAAGTMVDGYGNSGTVVDIENVDGSSLGDMLTGDGTANILNGFFGNDTLEGRGGTDTLDGGDGTDTASYANAAGAVIIDLGLQTASGADGSDTLVSIESAIGSAFSDRLFGDANGNSLSAGDGADFIIGGGGDDAILGGSGNDRAGYYHTNVALGGVTVSLALTGAQAVGGGQGSDTLSEIEHVSGTPFADTLTGDDGDNWLWGAAATISPGNVSTTNNDRLDGGAGNDLLTVGIGNHILIGGAGTDTVRFTENGAPETAVAVSLGSQGRGQNTGNGNWTLTGIENLSGGIGGDRLTGDDLANVLAGDLGADTLTGGGGNDVLIGDGVIKPDDNLVVQTTYDLVGGGNDILIGGRGEDFLYGGRGNDAMTGGADADSFVLQAFSGNDSVTDFGRTDRIVFDFSGAPATMSELTIVSSRGGTLISWGTGDSVFLEGVRPSAVTAVNFAFGPAAASSTRQANGLADAGDGASLGRSTFGFDTLQRHDDLFLGW